LHEIVHVEVRPYDAKQRRVDVTAFALEEVSLRRGVAGDAASRELEVFHDSRADRRVARLCNAPSPVDKRGAGPVYHL
jgi:hypothetical protein